MTRPRPQILFLDAYDSFTNNIISLLSTLLDADVKVLEIDDPHFDPTFATFKDDWLTELAHFDAVVCGPGPGSPVHSGDVGLMRHVFDLGDENALPVLGICLGFQGLLCSNGAQIRQLRQGLHGMIRPIEFRGGEHPLEGDIFEGVDPFKATLYHSLCIDVGQDHVPASEWPASRWQPFTNSPNMVPLAWAEESRDDGVERILMGAKHATLPFWGLQYHPESVCTEPAGQRVIQNWFKEALAWNQRRGRQRLLSSQPHARFCVSPSHLAALAGRKAAESKVGSGLDLSDYMLGSAFSFETVTLPPHVSVPEIIDIMGGVDGDQIILDSSNCGITLPKNATDVRGRYSIIALDLHSAVHFEYLAGADHVTLKLPSEKRSQDVKLGERYTDFWQFASHFLGRRRIVAPEGYVSPFLGGLMGYLTYEMGLHHLGVQLPGDRSRSRPDVHWAWVTKSLVIDHRNSVVQVQQLRPTSPDQSLSRQNGSENWLQQVAKRLQVGFEASCAPKMNGTSPHGNGTGTVPPAPTARPAIKSDPGIQIQLPSKTEYMAKVRKCQDYIARGESYELCLTNKVRISRPRPRRPSPNGISSNRTLTNGHTPSSTPSGPSSPWALYKSLRTRQPAPFGSYIRLGGTTFLSSSPERFLSCSRAGTCLMHPMKGTAKKSDAVRTLADAERVLRVPKEEAENLMIVDLVRHDLHAVCGPGNVSVPRLMRVEEYASVFQMITVVRGDLPQPQGDGVNGAKENAPGQEYTALDVLSASLPPGSMTGAPKKRSCEILRTIEGERERGVYSGVVGYVDVTGNADWSVNIRCLFRYDDECACGAAGDDCSPDSCKDGGEVWHVGAGGAVTTLSTAEGECEEMFTKLEGSLGLFR